MIRKFVTGSVVSVVFFLASAATAGPNDPFDPCFLHSGCFWSEGQSRWICSDQSIYAYCLSQGG